MTRVFGLFDDDRDVGRANSALEEAGFDARGIEIVDRGRIRETDDFGPGGGETIFVGTQGQAAAVVPQPNEPAAEDGRLTTASIREYMDDFDIPAEEAEFYASRIHQGGTLLIVDADDDQTDMALRIMRRFNAQTADAI